MGVNTRFRHAAARAGGGAHAAKSEDLRRGRAEGFRVFPLGEIEGGKSTLSTLGSLSRCDRVGFVRDH